MSIEDISIAFSKGEFDKTYHHIHDNAVWEITGNHTYKGLEKIIQNCKQTLDFFNSVTTEFRIIHTIAQHQKVAVTGTAKFLRNGQAFSFVSSCDIYEFDEHQKILNITSYCITTDEA